MAEEYLDREAETMPRGELERLQAQRARDCLVRMQASGIAYYRERLSGIDPETIRSPEDFGRLPFTVKDDLRDHYPFGLFLVPMERIVRIHASSGSTGKPTVVAYTRADLDLWSSTLARGIVAGGVGPGHVFQNAYGHGLFTGGLGFHDAMTRLGAVVVPTSAGNTARQVMLMRDFGAAALGATPSYALHIAEVALAEVGAEPTTEEMTSAIEERMGISVYEQYGLSEIIGPGVAAACGHADGMHVWEDHFIPEIVDPENGEPVPDGEVGELVLSAPEKEAFPVLRYRTRDLTRMTREPCPCGRTSARISRILGRSDDMMIVRGVNVFPSQIEHALLGVDGLEPHYQIVLSTRPDHQTEMLVRVETSTTRAADSNLEARARQALRDMLDLSVPVELVAPQGIPRSEGKAVRVLRQSS